MRMTVIIQVCSNKMKELYLGGDNKDIFDNVQSDCEKLINLAQHLVSE